MREWRWYGALTFVVVVLAVAVACQTVPITGRSQILLLSPQDEARMGTEAFQEILKKAKVSSDPALNRLVTRVGSRIAAVTGQSDLPWEYQVIEDAQANAFALPGGKIAVYTGILPITRDEAGLAAVLGHEVAHVIARHSGERVSQAMLAQGLASLVVGGVLRTDPQTTRVVSGLFAQGLLLPWGRSQESEADHLGLIYMAKAGYHPSAARDLWIRMAEATRGQPRPPEFLSTHPSSETRVRQIDAWLPEAMQHYRPRQ
jgi:metalloendopeptidase OMA1, mitochondrial